MPETRWLLPKGTEITNPATGWVSVTPCDCCPREVEFDVDGDYEDGRMLYSGHAIVTLKRRVVHCDFRDVREVWV